MSCVIQMSRHLRRIRKIRNRVGEVKVYAVSLSVYQSEQRYKFPDEF